MLFTDLDFHLKHELECVTPLLFKGFNNYEQQVSSIKPLATFRTFKATSSHLLPAAMETILTKCIKPCCQYEHWLIK